MRPTPGKTWLRQPTDANDTAWRAFEVFRDCMADARIGARRAIAEQFGVSYLIVCRWSSRYKWTLRAREFDSWRDQETCKIDLKDRRRIVKRQRETASALLELVQIELNRRITVARRPNALCTMRDRDLARVAEIAVRIQRLVTGKPTERVENLQHLTLQELKDLKALQEKARKE
jgi:hypothetical protein